MTLSVDFPCPKNGDAAVEMPASGLEWVEPTLSDLVGLTLIERLAQTDPAGAAALEDALDARLDTLLSAQAVAAARGARDELSSRRHRRLAGEVLRDRTRSLASGDVAAVAVAVTA